MTSPRARVTTTYDAAGRPVRRVVPSVAYAGSTCMSYGNCRRVPYFDLNGSGYLIPGEATYYRYDAAGNMLYAENADAIVAREYHPGGALKDDRLSLRQLDGVEFDPSYGIGYRYDAIGRLGTLIHPAQLAPPTQNQDVYTYHPNTGALSGVRDRNGNEFAFHYDNLGRPTSVHMPGGVVDTMRYDLDGRRTWRYETSPAGGGTLLQDETLVYDARGKLLQVNAGATLGRGASIYTQWYSGIGNLVATDWDNLQGLEWAREEFTVDPLGNRINKTTILPGPQNPSNDHPDYRYQLDPFSGRVSEVRKVDITTTPAPTDLSSFEYDASGNQDRSTQQVARANGTATELAQDIESRSFYGADERLRAFQEYSVSYSGGSGASSGVWEEYRYDPLGRRVMVITKRPPHLCDVSPSTCLESVTRFVWSGDQLLWERKSAEGLGAYVSEASGLVSYTHAGGIDRPLAIWKAEVGTVVTHQNWRGQFARGTFGAGPRAGQSSDCPDSPSNGCIPVPWPGWNTTAWHEGIGRPNTTGYEHYWMGSLATGMRDASGQLYMRNRYYDPQTGQFTQPDPIGLAGGLNSYGFAEGDPVSYTDPYGLRAEGPCDPPGSCETTGALVGAAVGGLAGVVVAGGCAIGSGGICSAGAPAIVGFFSTGGAAVGGLVGVLADAVAGDEDEADQRTPGPPTEIPATGPRVTSRQRRQVQEMGEAHGCHECGATRAGNNGEAWVGDHVPTTKLSPPGTPQVLRPHCRACSDRQGGTTAQELRRRAGRLLDGTGQ